MHPAYAKQGGYKQKIAGLPPTPVSGATR